MPKGLGGYQPDTDSASARRADFDLRRRIARLERGEGGGGTGPPGPPGPAGPPGTSYRTLVGGATTASVAHNLGSRDVNVEVYRNTAPYDSIDCEVEHTDANNLLLRFGVAPAADAYVCNVILGSPTGGGGGPTNYVHNQASPATTWFIDHNLGFYPNVTVTDTAGDQVEGTMSYVTPNQVRAMFTAAFAGIAYCS